MPSTSTNTSNVMTTLVNASCHCGENAFKVPFTTSSLPKTVHMCHCNICRHCTGNMSVVDPRIDGAPLSIVSSIDHRNNSVNLVPADLSNLTAYRSSSILTRYFCTTCNAHMFFRVNNDDDCSPACWTVMWGVLDRFDGIINIGKHIFVGDTLDGGIADHFRSCFTSDNKNDNAVSEERPFARIKGWQEGNTEAELLPFNWNANAGGYNVPDTLPLYCHCRRASFYLTRSVKPRTAAEYWLVPGKDASDPTRFITAHCLCNSCRLCSGGQIQTWTIVPNENVFDPVTKASVDLVSPETRPKSLNQYVSGDGKHRESCATCGATVFWWRVVKEGEAPHMDVATALIDEVVAGGSRAESWISWYHRLIFSEYALSKETASILERGVKASIVQPA